MSFDGIFKKIVYFFIIFIKTLVIWTKICYNNDVSCILVKKDGEIMNADPGQARSWLLNKNTARTAADAFVSSVVRFLL